MNKICTSIEQSRKLVELGIDINTADMFYADILVNNEHKYIIHPLESYGWKTFKDTKGKESNKLKFIPAWSLTALLNVIPEPDLVQNSEGTWLLHSWVKAYPWSVGGYSNPIDACVDMIVKLHEKEIL